MRQGEQARSLGHPEWLIQAAMQRTEKLVNQSGTENYMYCVRKLYTTFVRGFLGNVVYLNGVAFY